MELNIFGWYWEVKTIYFQKSLNYFRTFSIEIKNNCHVAKILILNNTFELKKYSFKEKKNLP